MRRIDEFEINFSEEKEPVKVEKETEEKKEEPSKNLKTLYDWMGSATAALIAVFILFAFFIRVATVDGISMNPTLNDGDIIIVTNKLGGYECGDIVVAKLKDEDKSIIKRVIAVGGQTVDIDFDRGIVSVDGEELVEPYTSEPTFKRGDVTFPLTVPEGFLFLLGDNRGDSKDSRMSSTGLIDERYILGVTKFRLGKHEKQSDSEDKGISYYKPQIIK